MSTRTLHRRFVGERGSVLITGLLLSVAVIIVIAAAIDIGQAFIAKRDLSSLADDAALAGSQAISIGALHEGHLQLDPEQARAQAQQTIAAYPHLTGQVSASTTGVTVTVTRQVPTILLGAIGMRSMRISAQASAAPRAP